MPSWAGSEAPLDPASSSGPGRDRPVHRARQAGSGTALGGQAPPTCPSRSRAAKIRSPRSGDGARRRTGSARAQLPDRVSDRRGDRLDLDRLRGASAVPSGGDRRARNGMTKICGGRSPKPLSSHGRIPRSSRARARASTSALSRLLWLRKTKLPAGEVISPPRYSLRDHTLEGIFESRDPRLLRRRETTGLVEAAEDFYPQRQMLDGF